MMGRPTPAPGQAQHPLKPLYTHSSWLFSRLLNEATGSLLDDVQLVNTLRTSKITATEVTEQLETSETTEINIDLAREVNHSDLRPRPLSEPPPLRPRKQRGRLGFPGPTQGEG